MDLTEQEALTLLQLIDTATRKGKNSPWWAELASKLGTTRQKAEICYLSAKVRAVTSR